MKKALLLVWAAAALLPGIGHAQWEWTRDGRKEFSDRPPSGDIPERNILRRPGANAPRASNAESPPAAAVPPKPVAPARDEELEARKKAAADAELARQRQQEQQNARRRAENCAQARDAQRTLDSGMRIAQLNPQGERVVLDDAARAAEGQRVQAAIAQECR
jgi:hypothetical protein